MKKIFFISLVMIQISLLNSSYSFSQNFAPLNLGNVWVWEKVEWGTIEKSVVVATNYIINNRSYHRILLYDSADIYLYNRFQNVDSLFYQYRLNYPYNDGQYPYYKFNCNLGDTFSFPLNQYANVTFAVIDTYLAPVFDTVLTVKILHRNAGGLVEHYQAWTDEIGLLSEIDHPFGNVTFNLKGCVINGRLYGDTSMTVNIDDVSFPELRFNLYQNYPNPFNPNSTIDYEYSALHIQVYDLLGSEVSILVDEEKFPGKYSVTFNGSNLVS